MKQTDEDVKMSNENIDRMDMIRNTIDLDRDIGGRFVIKEFVRQI